MPLVRGREYIVQEVPARIELECVAHFLINLCPVSRCVLLQLYEPLGIVFGQDVRVDDALLDDEKLGARPLAPADANLHTIPDLIIWRCNKTIIVTFLPRGYI
jgi:hypothetical protein